ncbi:MAG TPA: hypothetical protein VIX37_23570, partial [Candidatus Sulfotelmatobacter sp.]
NTNVERLHSKLESEVISQFGNGAPNDKLFVCGKFVNAIYMLPRDYQCVSFRNRMGIVERNRESRLRDDMMSWYSTEWALIHDRSSSYST